MKISLSLASMLLLCLSLFGQATRYARSVDSIGDLHSLPGSAFPTVVVSGPDGGLFEWSASSTAATNNINTVAAPYGASSGRYIRQPGIGGVVDFTGANYGLEFRNTPSFDITSGEIGLLPSKYFRLYTTNLNDVVDPDRRVLTLVDSATYEAQWLTVDELIGGNDVNANKVAVYDGSKKVKSADLAIADISTTVNNVAELVALSTIEKKVVRTLGYYSSGDGGGAFYRWAAGYSGLTNQSGGALAVDGGAWVQIDGDSAVDVRQFGASTTETDNGPMIQAALDYVQSGGLVSIPLGTFNLGTGLVVSNKTVRIEGSGTLNALSEITPLTIYGGAGTIYDVTNITNVEVELPYATTTTTVTLIETDGETAWNTGDIVKIVSDDVYAGSQYFTNFWRGEFAIVGACTNSSVWLTARLRDTYTTNPRITKWEDNRVKVSGITISSADDNEAEWHNNLVRIHQTRGTVFDRVRFINSNDRMVENRGGYGTIFDGCVFQNARNYSTRNQYGYGIDDIGSGFTLVVKCVGINLRHLYATTIRQVNAGSDEVWNMGPVEHATISHSVSQGTSNSGFDTHGNAYDVTFNNCTAVGAYEGSGSGGPGFTVRGQHVSIIDCRAYNCAMGIFVYEDNRDGETANVLISGFQGRNSSNVGLKVGAVSPSLGIQGITVRDSEFDGAVQPALIEDAYDVAIEGSTFSYKYAEGVTPANKLVEIGTRTSGVADPTIRFNGNTLVMTNTAIAYALAIDDGTTLTGDGNRFYIASASETSLLFGGSTGSNALTLTESTLDEAPAAVSSGTWTGGMRASLRGAIDTRWIEENVASDGPVIGDTFYNGLNTLDNNAEPSVVVTLKATATTYYGPMTAAALGDGMFTGQRVRVNWVSTNQFAETLRIPASGYGFRTPDFRDALLSNGESVDMVWTGTDWLADSAAQASDGWFTGPGGARAAWGNNNNAYTELSGFFTNGTSGSPWSVMWAGDIPQKVPSSSATLFGLGNTSAGNAAANTAFAWINSFGQLVVRARDSGNTAQDATYAAFSPYFGGRTIDLVMARPRSGTALQMFADGRRLQPYTDHTISTTDGIRASPNLVIGRGQGNAGYLGDRVVGAAVYSFAPGPAVVARMHKSGPDWVYLQGSTTDTSAETVTFVEASIATGTAIVAGTLVPAGLTTGTTYYLRHVSGDAYTFHATWPDAVAGTSTIDLTSTVNGTHWYVRPVAWWRMSDVSAGRIQDSGPNGMHLTTVGTVTAVAPLRTGQPVQTITAAGGTLTIPAGDRVVQSLYWAADGDATLEWSGAVDGDSGTLYIHPAATNVTMTLDSNVYSPSGTTFTVTGDGSTNYTMVAWQAQSIGGTVRISANASNNYR